MIIQNAIYAKVQAQNKHDMCKFIQRLNQEIRVLNLNRPCNLGLQNREKNRMWRSVDVITIYDTMFHSHSCCANLVQLMPSTTCMVSTIISQVANKKASMNVSIKQKVQIDTHIIFN